MPTPPPRTDQGAPSHLPPPRVTPLNASFVPDTMRVRPRRGRATPRARAPCRVSAVSATGREKKCPAPQPIVYCTRAESYRSFIRLGEPHRGHAASSPPFGGRRLSRLQRRLHDARPPSAAPRIDLYPAAPPRCAAGHRHPQPAHPRASDQAGGALRAPGGAPRGAGIPCPHPRRLRHLRGSGCAARRPLLFRARPRVDARRPRRWRGSSRRKTSGASRGAPAGETAGAHRLQPGASSPSSPTASSTRSRRSTAKP